MVETRLESLNIAETTLREHPEIKPKREKLADEKLVEYCDQLAELAVEKAHLGYLLYQETGLPAAERKKEKPKRKLPLEKELKAVAEGKIDQVLREKPEEPVPELRNRLEVVDAQIKTLVAYPQVVERYREEFAKKVEIIQRAREIEKLRKWAESLNQANVELILKRQKSGLSKPDEEILSRNKKRIAAAKERMVALEKKPEILLEERRRILITYRRQLEEEKFVETPQVKELVDTLAARIRQGEPVLLWGDTGTGKTETVRRVSRKLFGVDPKLFSGTEEATHYDLFGKTQLGPEGSYFEDGPATKALRKGVPLLVDEVDLVPHAIIGRIQDLLTRRPGDTVTIQENSNEKIIVPEGFIIMATGNIRSAKYLREKLDPAFLRRHWQREVKYLSPNESYDILLAALIDRRGALKIGSRQNLEDLKNLCQAAKFVQDVFTGEKTDFMGEGAEASRGIGTSLENATLSIGELLDIVKGWKAENFTRPLEDFILSEFIQSQTVRQDQRNLVKIFCLHGFFKDKKAKDFDISGLTEEKLLAYRAETV